MTTIEHKTLAHRVHERLRVEILEGKLRAGDCIKQEELTERLGVSRTPIREAIQRLEAEGLVHYIRRGSAVVTAIPRREIEEIFELRALLEGHAADKAADALNEKVLAKLRRLITEMDEYHLAKDLRKVLLKNEEFHRTICALAQNETLLRMLSQIWRDIRRLRFDYLIAPGGFEESTRDHKALVAALEQRDKTLIRKIVQEHAGRTMSGILDILDRHSPGNNDGAIPGLNL
jgi:DNA-binding GntR family transcriptional regulator